MCVDCVLALSRITQVDPSDGPLLEVVLSQRRGPPRGDAWAGVALGCCCSLHWCMLLSHPPGHVVWLRVGTLWSHPH
jgi:hypothetical protein